MKDYEIYGDFKHKCRPYTYEILCVTSAVYLSSRTTLLLLVINDAEDILFDTSVHTKMFADDTKLCISYFTHSLPTGVA